MPRNFNRRKNLIGMLGLEQLIIYIIFCYSVTAVSNTWLMLIDIGQMFEFWQAKVLQPLSRMENKFAQLLYKASGGCEACNTMWFALILFPVYMLLTAQYELQIADNIPSVIAFWLLAPMLAYDFLIIKNN